MTTKKANGGPSPGGEIEPLDSVRSFARGWDRFWFAPADPTTLGLMRFFAGIVILYTYFAYSFDLMSYVSWDGAWIDEPIVNYYLNDNPNYDMPNDWPDMTADIGTHRVVSKGQNAWSIFFHIRDHRWIWVTHGAVLVILFLFTIGFATRITSVLAFLGAVSYVWRAQTSIFGLDSMIVVVLFYMMIGPAGAALSVDRWLEVRRERRRQGKPDAEVPLPASTIANFTMRLFQIHYCLIYLASGTSKLLGPAWLNGTALWECYANYSFAPMHVYLYSEGLRFLCRHRWLWEVVMSGGALFTIFLELSFAYLVWLKRWRWFMVAGSVMLHTGIGLFMGLVTFSLIMLVWVMAFLPPEATQLFLARVVEYSRWLRQTIYGTATPKAEPALSR